MVEITGNFIYFDGKFTKTLTSKDGPQTFDPSLEARLVKEGTARYINTMPDTKEEKSEPDSGTVDIPNLKNMSLKELKDYAESLGVDIAGLRKKSDIVDAILDEQIPPTFGA